MPVKGMNKAQAWDYALGMIRVDGLEPTQEFLDLVEKEKRGEMTREDIKKVLDKKYRIKDEASGHLACADRSR